MFGNNSFGNSSFGGSTFGTSFGATPSLGPFGATAQTQAQTQATPVGTTIRFVPLEGTDQVQKTGGAGGATQIRTRHQNISAMKEYESKSTEELRLEDYAANRKAGQPMASAFGSTTFTSMPSTSTQSTSLFGNQSQPTTNLFGTPTQGQTSNVFGVQNSNNIFGSSLNKPTTTTTSSPFNIGTNQFNANTSTTGGQTGFPLFGNNAQTSTTPFGASNVNSPFKSNIFSAQPSTSTNSSIFGTNTNTGFGALNSNQTTNQTQAQPFGATTSIFGTTNNATNTFGAPNPFNTQPKTGFDMNSGANTGGIFNSLNKPATTVANPSPFQIGTPFNTNTSTAGGLSLFNTTSQANTSAFGANSLNTPNKTSLFSAPTTTTTSIFGTNNTSNFLGASQPAAQTQPQPFGTSTSIFGNTANTTTNAFGSSNLFNTQPKTGFDLNSNNNTGGIFNTLNKPATTLANSSPFQLGNPINTTTTSNTGGLSLFNTNPQANTSAFGFNSFSAPNDSNLFNNSAANNSATFGNNNPSANQQQLRLDLLLNRLKTLPYGETSILPSDTNASNTGLGSLKFTTDPKTINQYKMKAKTNVNLNKPSSSEKTMANSVLFDGLDNNTNDDMRCAIDIFVPKKNIKKLDLTPSSHLSEGDAEHAVDSPAFERSRSNIASRSMRDVTIDGSSSGNTRRVRYADNTFPGLDHPNTSYNPSFNYNESSDLSSFHNSSLNRGNASNQSLLNTTPSPNRSGLNSRSGFINTRSDYRTKPSFEEIEKRYNPETGTCIIDSLLIERSNYGSILYECSLDVRGINLDEIVHIRRKEVVVYPDDENKPPVGQGLNRPAIVTLHQVWPIDKSNSEIIKDIDRLNLMRYPEKIESLTIEKGARFIEYRPETGSWVFGVKHFSKYGITDDDEELPAPAAILPANNQSQPSPMPLQQHQQQQNQIHQTTHQPSPQNNGLLLNRLKTTASYNESPLFLNNSKQSTRSQLNNQSQNSVKPIPENKVSNQFKMSAKTSVKLSDQPTLEKTTTNSILSESFDNSFNYSMRNVIDLLDQEEEDEDLDTTKGDMKRSFTVHGNKRLALQNISANISTASYDKPIVLGSSIPIQRRVRDLKIKPNLYAAQNKFLRDIMSTCVSGAPRIRFINGSRKFCHVQGDKVVVQELKLVPSDATGSELAEEIKERFELFLENNSLITSLNMNPVLAPYIETYDFISNASSYGLLHALYGPLISKTPYAKQDERLNRVINWLSSVNQKLPPPTNIYQLIIYHMSCDRYDTASELAMESNHPRLALILSTLNLNKDNMFEQLSSWRMSTADQHIDEELLKIYILLAGLTEWKLSNDVTIKCLKGLKWTQQLCLLALHVTSFVTEPDKYGFYMLPLYIKRLETNTNDVDYHIMARHNPAKIISAAESLVEEWFLLESLKSFHVINSETECVNSDIIHCNLASQLAPIDLRWACFVALHIINNEVRNQILIRCLEQNHSQLTTEKHDSDRSNPTISVELWLVDKLKVPTEFIENVRKNFYQ